MVVYCPMCLATGKEVEVARILPEKGENDELVWEALCPECGARGTFTPTKQHKCPHCSKTFTEPVRYRSTVPGV